MNTPNDDDTDRLIQQNQQAALDVELDAPLQLEPEGLAGFVHTQVEINKAIVERLNAINKKVDDIQGDVKGLRDDMGVMKGWQTELAVERRAGQIFTRLCDGELLRIYPAGELGHYIDRSRRNGSMAKTEIERAQSIDCLLEGTDNSGTPVMYAVEISYTAGPDDINRASEKAKLLTQLLGRQVRPAVVGEDFTAQFETKAAPMNVAHTYIHNGDSIKR